MKGRQCLSSHMPWNNYRCPHPLTHGNRRSSKESRSHPAPRNQMENQVRVVHRSHGAVSKYPRTLTYRRPSLRAVSPVRDQTVISQYCFPNECLLRHYLVHFYFQKIVRPTLTCMQMIHLALRIIHPWRGGPRWRLPHQES